MSEYKRSVLPALAAAALIAALTTTPAVAAGEPWQRLGTKDFRLRASSVGSGYDALVKALPNASMRTVLDSANRRARRFQKPACITAFGPTCAAAFLWQSGDGATRDWMPQGITTSSDADGRVPLPRQTPLRPERPLRRGRSTSAALSSACGFGLGQPNTRTRTAERGGDREDRRRSQRPGQPRQRRAAAVARRGARGGVHAEVGR